ncbi:hypothetical protein T484DRAFT_1855987 [Baffinella frigidus]|nr:hypothetical protein T484DRAFT_1855987 [Cryptophyta sp. CCMP2293]
MKKRGWGNDTGCMEDPQTDEEIEALLKQYEADHKEEEARKERVLQAYQDRMKAMDQELDAYEPETLDYS